MLDIAFITVVLLLIFSCILELTGCTFMDQFVYTGTNVLYFYEPVCVDWN